MLRNKGYTPELVPGKDMVRFSVEGATCLVNFYACTNAECESLQYNASWRTTDKFSVELLNEHTRNKRFARAYLDKDKDPVLSMDVSLEGGVTMQSLIESANRWRILLLLFRRTLTNKTVE
jgi:hypothetical protein